MGTSFVDQVIFILVACGEADHRGPDPSEDHADSTVTAH